MRKIKILGTAVMACAILQLAFSQKIIAETVTENDKPNMEKQSQTPNWRTGIIEDQTFQTTFSEYDGDTWFASYPPIDGEKDVMFKIIQNDQVVETLDSLVVPPVLETGFTSLDAVSFTDYNGDGNTDILVVKTFGDTAVPVIYEGTPENEKKFTLRTGLSVRAAAHAQTMTISGILDYLKTVENEQWSAVDALPDGTPSDFIFSSGVGAWSTSLTLNKDGSFSGSFSDSDMTGGDGYSYTVYCNDFTGSFTNLKKLNDHVYSMELVDLQTSQESGTQEIVDDCLKVYSEPYGLAPGSEFYLYVPEVTKSDLPIELPEGWSMIAYSDQNPELLTSYVLYNIEGDAPFAGYQETQS